MNYYTTEYHVDWIIFWLKNLAKIQSDILINFKKSAQKQEKLNCVFALCEKIGARAAKLNELETEKKKGRLFESKYILETRGRVTL